MFFRKFPRFSGYSRPSSSTIRSALWENAHRSLAALGLLLATAGGALLPTSVLSCSRRLPQEGQHQKTVAPRMPTNLLHHGSQNRIQKTSRNMAARKGPRLYDLGKNSVEINKDAPQWTHFSVWNRKYIEARPGNDLRRLWQECEPAIGRKITPSYDIRINQPSAPESPSFAH